MTQTMLDLAEDAHDFDFVDALNEPVNDTWATREYAGALAMVAGAVLDERDPGDLTRLIADHLGMQVNHHQPHARPQVQA